MGGAKLNGLFHLSIEEEFLNTSLSQTHETCSPPEVIATVLQQRVAHQAEPLIVEVLWVGCHCLRRRHSSTEIQ